MPFVGHRLRFKLWRKREQVDRLAPRERDVLGSLNVRIPADQRLRVFAADPAEHEVGANRGGVPQLVLQLKGPHEGRQVVRCQDLALLNESTVTGIPTSGDSGLTRSSRSLGSEARDGEWRNGQIVQTNWALVVDQEQKPPVSRRLGGVRDAGGSPCVRSEQARPREIAG